MSDGLDKAQFTAAIPDIMSGIKTGSDGLRFQMDVPETEMGEAIKLINMRGKLLKVTVEVIQNDGRKQQQDERKLHI